VPRHIVPRHIVPLASALATEDGLRRGPRRREEPSHASAQQKAMEREMSLSGEESRALAAIERRISASEPRLSACF
jgi:hypothetical protein